MSEVTNVEQTTNQLITNYDVSKFLLGFNSFVSGDVRGPTGGFNLLQGMVMGRESGTQRLAPLDITATDGRAYPAGICIIDHTVPGGEEHFVSVVNKGKIAEGKINFLGSETLDTPLGTSGAPGALVKTLRDWLNDLGLELAGGEELTKFDNQ